jgi:hypothetical protein
MYNGVGFIQLYLGCLILTFLDLDLGNQTLFFPFKLYVGSYLLIYEVLIGLLQTGYDTLLLHIGLFHFGIILHHSLQINLEMFQIVVGFPIELIELNINLL